MNKTRISAVFAATLIGALAFLGFVPTASAQPVTRETWIAERTNPAVQLIATSYTATVSSRPIDLSQAGIALFDVGIYKYEIGELQNPDEVVNYVFDRIATNPTYYLREVGQARTKRLSTYSTGTGWVADPVGYVVTAKHVVTSSADVTKSFANQGAEWFAKADAKTLLNLFKEWDLSSHTVKNIENAVSEFGAEKVKVRVDAPKASVILGTASADGSRVGKAYPAEVVYESGKELGEDVAVLRIQAQGQQLPSLSLASAGAAQGEPVFLDAFPSLPDRSEAAMLQPTVTSGQITAIKPNDAGLQLVQHSAIASPGASGGPALNEAGEVIGIHVAGAVSENGPLGQGYLMPLETVKSALARSGATPTPGATTTLYNEALDLFYNNHYQAALEKFRQVKELFPAHAYVDSYISRTQLAISRGEDVPLEQPLPWTVILIAGAGVLALTSGAVGYGLSRRGRRRSNWSPDPTWAREALHQQSGASAAVPGQYDLSQSGRFNDGLTNGSAQPAGSELVQTKTGDEGDPGTPPHES